MENAVPREIPPLGFRFVKKSEKSAKRDSDTEEEDKYCFMHICYFPNINSHFGPKSREIINHIRFTPLYNPGTFNLYPLAAEYNPAASASESALV